MQKVQEVILIQEDRRKNPLIVDQTAAERMIRAHLGDKENKTSSREIKNIKETNNSNQKEDLFELEDSELIDLNKNKHVKNTRKLSRNKSLLPSDGLISWKEKIEKLLK